MKIYPWHGPEYDSWRMSHAEARRNFARERMRDRLLIAGIAVAWTAGIALFVLLIKP